MKAPALYKHMREAAARFPSKHARVIECRGGKCVEIVVDARGRVAHSAFGPGWEERGWVKGHGPDEVARALKSIGARVARSTITEALPVFEEVE